MALPHSLPSRTNANRRLAGVTCKHFAGDNSNVRSGRGCRFHMAAVQSQHHLPGRGARGIAVGRVSWWRTSRWPTRCV